jgi:hypothetical protein
LCDLCRDSPALTYATTDEEQLESELQANKYMVKLLEEELRKRKRAEKK